MGKDEMGTSGTSSAVKNLLFRLCRFAQSGASDIYPELWGSMTG
jgi:hypothetical protein